MDEHSSEFRDFGILPEGIPPPAGTIRAYFSTGRVVGQYIGTGIVAAIGLGLIALFALLMPLWLGLLACAAALAGFGLFIFLATHHDYRWVELDGDTLRARHLYTGRVIERGIDEIECLATMVYQVRRAETVVIEKLLGRIKGVEIRFRDRRTPLRILRADPAMTHAKELIEAVLYRMGQLRELDADIVRLDGQPLVRNIHWQGEQPSKPPGKGLKVTLVCLIALALVFGAIFGFWGLQVQELHEVASKPPHELSVRALIDHGPGANRHVVVTDFSPGGYAFDSKAGAWKQVWIALFPAGARPDERREIKVVISSKDVGNEAVLRQWLQGGRIRGMCSESLRSSWGTALGPNLVQANQGAQLTSAWSISELRERPSAALVTSLLSGAVGCFAAVMLLAALVFWKAG